MNYIVHDSPSLDDPLPETTDRILATKSIGLPGVSPPVMIRCMEGLTADQAEIKRRAGRSGRGRKIGKAYGHLICSWDENENPTIEHMFATTIKALRAAGISEKHYGMIAIHSDGRCLHTHTAFCRIDPDTGIAAKLTKAYTKLSQWSHDYERDHGGIIVEKRARRWGGAENENERNEIDRPTPPPSPRKVRDGAGRAIVRTAAERQEWTELLRGQATTPKPKPEARAERAALNRRQTESRIEATRDYLIEISTRTAPQLCDPSPEPQRPPQDLDRSMVRATSTAAQLCDPGPEPQRPPQDLDRSMVRATLTAAQLCDPSPEPTREPAREPEQQQIVPAPSRPAPEPASPRPTPAPAPEPAAQQPEKKVTRGEGRPAGDGPPRGSTTTRDQNIIRGGNHRATDGPTTTATRTKPQQK